MACRNAYRTRTTIDTAPAQVEIKAPEAVADAERLLFGVDSKIPADDILQNNIDQFEWVVRNKIYPNFYGRNITGENCLTVEEIDFLHSKACKIAAIYASDEKKESEEEGKAEAKKAALAATELGIPYETAIFLEVADGEFISSEYMKGFAEGLIDKGYTPAFKASTDAAFGFDKEFSRGMQHEKEIFSKCIIWATSPSLAEYDGMTTSHFIHPDNWKPFAPSGIKRREIAIWQYGKDCHPIEDDNGRDTVFNVDLVRNEDVIIFKMF